MPSIYSWYTFVAYNVFNRQRNLENARRNTKIKLCNLCFNVSYSLPFMASRQSHFSSCEANGVNGCGGKCPFFFSTSLSHFVKNNSCFIMSHYIEIGASCVCVEGKLWKNFCTMSREVSEEKQTNTLLKFFQFLFFLRFKSFLLIASPDFHEFLQLSFLTG
jgi:hypothetical protein